MISSRTMLALLLAAPAWGLAENTAESHKPIVLICPWAAGGGTDILARALAKQAEKALAQPVMVINITGGGGALGHDAIRSAPADGYTIGMITFELNSQAVQGITSFDYRQIDPLMRINTDAAALTVREDAPFNNLKEFISYAKAHPRQVSIGNSAPASVWHIGAGLFADKTGIKVRHVPFEGGHPAVNALVEGHIKAVAVSLPEVQQQVLAGKLKILGVMDEQRQPLFPDIPTFQEQGVPVNFATWRGLAAPKGLPQAARERLIQGFKQAYDSPEFQNFAAQNSLHLAYQDRDQFSQFLAQNYQEVMRIMKQLGLAKHQSLAK